MIYLSIRSASTSVKENFDVNGSISDPKISSELKILLERYAKMLGFSFSEAIEVVSGVSGGLKSSEVCDCTIKVLLINMTHTLFISISELVLYRPLLCWFMKYLLHMIF